MMDGHLWTAGFDDGTLFALSSPDRPDWPLWTCSERRLSTESGVTFSDTITVGRGATMAGALAEARWPPEVVSVLRAAVVAVFGVCAN